MVVSDIIREAGSIFYVQPIKLKTECRERPVLLARNALCRALKTRGSTYMQIGRWLNKDHSTIIHSVKNADALMETDPDYYEKIGKLVKLTHQDCQKDYSFKIVASN